eukprot:snap_masked-scaffold_5-processed-gene-17.32-mRNA-1 protein AED:1.00 eAED:1.00 QI:0/0/0/0/1/1/3/0/72
MISGKISLERLINEASNYPLIRLTRVGLPEIKYYRSIGVHVSLEVNEANQYGNRKKMENYWMQQFNMVGYVI